MLIFCFYIYTIKSPELHSSKLYFLTIFLEDKNINLRGWKTHLSSLKNSKILTKSNTNFLQKIYLLSSVIYIGQLFIFWIEILFTKIIETTNHFIVHSMYEGGL